jgi:hypothetical protein
MMMAAVAFAVQGTLIAVSQTATGENSHYHHGYAHIDAFAPAKSQLVTHVHGDGTVHQHAVNDDDGALDEHIQEPGCPCCWNMAVIAGVLPGSPVCTTSAAASSRLVFKPSDPFRDFEFDGLRRPPRPPSIA